jgi:dolichyl-phosphate-mannose--protein O-mannosyl transferase
MINKIIKIQVFVKMMITRIKYIFRFDEMHYGKYVAQYLKRTFFFDANPPLGKLLIAMAAYLADFDGKISLYLNTLF